MNSSKVWQETALELKFRSACLKKKALNNQENREGGSGSWILLAEVELDTDSCSSLLSKRKQAEGIQATNYSSGSIHLFNQISLLYSS